MKNFDIVKKLVETEKLRIITVLATVRSGSTLLGNILSKSSSVNCFVMHPFQVISPVLGEPMQNREDKGYGNLLSAYQNEKKQGSSPVVLILKDMWRNVGHMERFHRLQSVSDKLIVTCRNPLLSVESSFHIDFPVMEQYQKGLSCNLDHYAFDNGFNDAPEKKQKWRDGNLGCGAHWKKASYFMVKKRKYNLLRNIYMDFLYKFNINCYQPEVLRELDQMDGIDKKLYFSYSSLSWLDAFSAFSSFDKNTIIVDYTLLCAKSSDILLELSERVDIKYSYDMVSGFHKTMINNFEGGVFSRVEEDLPYYEGTINKNSIKYPSKSPQSTEAFPKDLVQHMYSCQFPLYLKMLCHKNFLSPKTYEDTFAFLNKRCPKNNIKLQDIDPVFAFFLLAALTRKKYNNYKNMMLNIQNKHKKYKDIYEIVNEELGGR